VIVTGSEEDDEEEVDGAVEEVALVAAVELITHPTPAVVGCPEAVPGVFFDKNPRRPFLGGGIVVVGIVELAGSVAAVAVFTAGAAILLLVTGFMAARTSQAFDTEVDCD